MVATSANGGLIALDAASGKTVGPKISPKTADTALATAVVDSRGALLASLTKHLSLAWPNNTSPQAGLLHGKAFPRPLLLLDPLSVYAQLC